jgi:hypothetical protein
MSSVVATANSGSGIKSKMAGMFTASNIVTGISGAVFVSLFIAAFIQMSKFLGSKDDWNELKPKMTQIGLLIVIGVVAFAVMSTMYFVQNPLSAAYFSIVISCLSMGLAYASLAYAAISR